MHNTRGMITRMASHCQCVSVQELAGLQGYNRPEDVGRSVRLPKSVQPHYENQAVSPEEGAGNIPDDHPEHLDGCLKLAGVELTPQQVVQQGIGRRVQKGQQRQISWRREVDFSFIEMSEKVQRN